MAGKKSAQVNDVQCLESTSDLRKLENLLTSPHSSLKSPPPHKNTGSP